MNKKVMKITSTILMILMIVSTIIPVFAAESAPAGPSAISEKPAKGIGIITQAGGSLLTILRTVGIVLSLVILTIIGIKYMLGSAEEKSEYKKSLLPYVIGAALIFAAAFFAGGIYDFFSGLGASAAAA